MKCVRGTGLTVQAHSLTENFLQHEITNMYYKHGVLTKLSAWHIRRSYSLHQWSSILASYLWYDTVFSNYWPETIRQLAGFCFVWIGSRPVWKLDTYLQNLVTLLVRIYDSSVKLEKTQQRRFQFFRRSNVVVYYNSVARCVLMDRLSDSTGDPHTESLLGFMCLCFRKGSFGLSEWQS